MCPLGLFGVRVSLLGASSFEAGSRLDGFFCRRSVQLAKFSVNTLIFLPFPLFFFFFFFFPIVQLSGRVWGVRIATLPPPYFPPPPTLSLSFLLSLPIVSSTLKHGWVVSLA